jgi:hypothetical protein
MFWCWLKGVLLALSVVGTVLGGIALSFLFIFGCIWLGDKLSDVVKANAPSMASIGSTAGKVIIVILLATAVLGGIVRAKEQVCMVGFKKAYVSAFTPDDKK